MSKNLTLSNSGPSLPSPPVSITIAGGSTVTIDDYVYLQPEYDEPYFIGRVMEFVYVPRVRQPKPLLSMTGAHKQLVDKLTANSSVAANREGTPTPSPTPHDTVQLRVRLAWLQRARDLPVTRVRAKDTKLLAATMTSDLNPVSAIKGKCYVRHVSEIADLRTWKALPDHYFYTQLFDRYSTRLYDIIPVSQIRNAPQEVLQKLLYTYEFIFAETQKINDLVSTRRACTVCAKWCSINESVKCSLCEKHYHLQCLDPPPARKPAKGYGWQCAACLRRLQDQRTKSTDDAITESPSSTVLSALVDIGDYKRVTRNKAAEESFISLRSLSGNVTPGTSNATAGTNAGSDTESRPWSKRLKLSHGDNRVYADGAGSPIPRPRNRGLWPFRYFGINTNIEDVLHDDERIYPRAVSRIGPKYQAIIPDMVSPSGPELDRQLIAESAKVEKIKDHKPNGKITHDREKSPNLHSTTNGRSSNGQFSAGHSYHGHRAGREGNGTGQGIVTGAGGGGGGGGTTRWHGKNAEQMDRMWDEIELRRGNHDALLFFRQPKFLADEELKMYMEAIVPFLRRHMENIRDFTLLDCQDAALHGLALHNYDVEEALISIPDCPEGYVRQRVPGDYWTPESLLRFNDCLREYGSNLQSIHESLPAITRRAVTLHYYLVRHSKTGEQLLEAYTNRNHGGQRRTNLGQGESAVNTHPEVASEVGQSGVNTPASSPRNKSDEQERPLLRCANCASERATRWHPAPPELAFHNTRSAKASAAQRMVCSDCRTHWLHYGVMPDLDASTTRKAHQQYAQAPIGGNGTRSSTGRDESRRGNSRGRPVLPKARAPEPWPLTPCGVCKLPTTNSAEMAALVCQDCGLCVHTICSGYPEGVRAGSRRWKCGICTNITNPAVSINYACILCRQDPPHASEQPRQMMWRTSGNNWVHSLCALAMRETTLVYSHGNVTVGNTMAIPAHSWTRPCDVCRRANGAALKCCESQCAKGAHASCISLLDRRDSTQSVSRAALVIRSVGGPGVLKICEDVDLFVSKGGKAEIALKCASHSGSNNTHSIEDQQSININSVDSAGRPAIAAVIGTKMTRDTSTGRSAMLRSSIASWQMTRPPSPMQQPKQSPQPSVNSDIGKPNLPSPARSSYSEVTSNSNAVAWANPADDPTCSQCSASFSPIWWPVSRGTAANASSEPGTATNIKVLCHRCYSADATGSASHKVAPL
ncbi:hypothetical protein COEREDRAFT_16103 [Coemansia reversa NRRL 1564]|uniref:PHD-type domain-containing protein n=1 Tax=Coemansia reversa (strain ATCC 12441 / NRRL 1564) TaxID=763665 RepID=A0A2G5B8R7_COERN|nr:hypothetical protein COEREDRAFT_16103 [Coemansia reversa NRRL 1564]|eukprot:PIA15405.1 hypothetical protein COEREDRAFT_16103 [Coemansia reversa NRRL 1564]